ncbi:MAG: hypothetical protein Q8P90_05535 [bacterium]|nr:hypothetical protein [bacterium]
MSQEKTNSNGRGILPSASVLQKLVVEFTIRERWFLVIILVGLTLAGVALRLPLGFTMAIGFIFASYPVIANDSIQTLGTFIASNRDVAWWKKWLFMGGIFIITMVFSWIMFDGDLSFQRLASKGFNETPTAFHYLQIIAPLALLVLTRLRIPVSTSLLILTAFATEASAIQKVVMKSLNGYVLAFVGAVILWGLITRLEEKLFTSPAKPYWRWLQWITTGILWSFWWQQDAANIAVYLPRQIPLIGLIGFLAVIFFGLGLLMKKGGERIQQIVEEKSYIVDIRSATIIDALYAVILWYFKVISNIPMSTTWVFLGLLAGRELMIALRSKRKGKRSFWSAGRIIALDAVAATIGLIISLIIGASVNGISF